jgi:hypothetical protein
LRSKGKPILEDLDRLWDKEKPILGKAKQLSGNTDWLSGKTEPESRRTESEPGKIESSSSKEKLVLGNTNQLPGNVDRLSGKAVQKLSRVRVRQNQDRVPDAGYGKSWNQLRVKKKMRNRLLRRASPGTLVHL